MVLLGFPRILGILNGFSLLLIEIHQVKLDSQHRVSVYHDRDSVCVSTILGFSGQPGHWIGTSGGRGVLRWWLGVQGVVAAMASMVAMEAKVVEVVMATTVAAVQAISIHYQLVVLSSTSFNGFFIHTFSAGNSWISDFGPGAPKICG